MRAIWIVPPEVKQIASGSEPEQALLGYWLASIRTRAAVAALEWKRGGNENVFWDPAATGTGQNLDWSAVNICVVPKFYPTAPREPWYQVCANARESGCPLLIDLCDYPFAMSAQVQAFYSDVLKICDALVVNSERMAELMGPHVSLRPIVIEDAILGVARNPEFAPAGRLRLLWFGHPGNLRHLDACLEGLIQFARETPCRLTVVTMSGYGAEEVAQQIEARFRPALEARFVEWSLEAMAGALRRADLVLIPSDPADPMKAGVSANRLGVALWAGRFAIATPMPSYLAFSDAAWLGHDLIEGIRWALANRLEVRARIRRGQMLVAEKLAADAIGRQWRSLLERLASGGSP
jgi:hypothetical protein